jgi:hypothetical protein
MNANVVVLGASLGGLVAAAELRERGHKVSVIERGKSVGGLYNKTSTPFGTQELGMHVLYADERHYRHLCKIFGQEVFHVLRGPRVDLGGSINFGEISFGSHYPNLLSHPLRTTILTEIQKRSPKEASPTNALDEAQRRFGTTAACEIVAPILRKLWLHEPTRLSPHALHCFFDLRRLVICEKAEADRLKAQPELDEVIANPDQLHPSGQVFGGRMGLTFKTEFSDLNDRVANWAAANEIQLQLGVDVECVDGVLSANGTKLHEAFDACLVAAPMHTLADTTDASTDRLELSICYFQLDRHLKSEFPSYYILAHDARYRASRIVNYDAYNMENPLDQPSVIAVESVHLPGYPPEPNDLITELSEILPFVKVTQTYRLPRSVTVWAPTLDNACRLDKLQQSIARHFGTRPLYFTGMRTDTGVFFSHHTIGLAYESALACHKRLASS